MKLLHPLVFLLAAFAPFVPSAGSEPSGLNGGDVETSIALMDLYGKQPEAVHRLYREAYRVLAADPKASFAALADDETVQRLCREQGVTHWGGPMLGCVTPEGARVWLRTVRPARVEVRVTVDGAEETFGPVESTAKSDMTAVVPVTGLKPGTRYPYRVLVDGKPVAVPPGAAIATAPAESKTGKVRIAFGSCFHRWGLGNKTQADLIRSRQPAALLLLGDIAVQDRKNHLGFHRADYLLREFHPGWRDLVASVPVYATWDDHDYFANDKAGIPKNYTAEDRDGVRDAFRRAWNNPSYGLGDPGGGIFLRSQIGPCDIIMADNRYFRENREGSFLGDEQMKWLEAQLLDCKAPFIILSCGTMWSDYVSDGKDSWGKWDPDGRERVFSLIEKHRIGGALLISGDRHGARGFRIPRPSGFEFYEFEGGSLGGRRGPPPTDPEWETQLYGISNQYAFSEFNIDATLPDPEVTFNLIADDGKIIYSITLTRSRLTPGGSGGSSAGCPPAARTARSWATAGSFRSFPRGAGRSWPTASSAPRI